MMLLRRCLLEFLFGPVQLHTQKTMPSSQNNPSQPIKLLAELPADPARQAVATIRGYIYQFWWSVDAWLQLQSADDVIYLEGAEDLDKVTTNGAITEQIKHEAASISLNNQRAHKALENFWLVSEKEQSRRVDFHYISTAVAAREQDGIFGEVCGIEAWRIAKTSAPMAELIHTYLSQKLPPDSRLAAFLKTASSEEVQSRLLRRFYWFLGQAGVDDVKQSVEDRITIRFDQKNIHLSYVTRARDRLYAYVNEVITQEESLKRRLTAADLLREMDAATTDHIAIPALLHQQLVAAMSSGAFDPGEALLRNMRLPLPRAPSPLLPRVQVVAEVRQHVEERRAVLLTGTVFKGKTTIAQLVANEVTPDAWWFPVSMKTGSETDNLLRALAAVIDKESTPVLVVIDDIDLSPESQAAYRFSLALVASRANRSGRGLILTALGTPSGSTEFCDFGGIATVDVPEMSTEEIADHCAENGCPLSILKAWSALIRGNTGGHPKLVQVRIAELSGNNWPMPVPSDLIAISPAIGSARQFARQLLINSSVAMTADFLYTAAEATFPLTRPMLIRLIEKTIGSAYSGDVIDFLQGKWLETIVEDRIRVTSILKGSAAEVWTIEKQKLAHQYLYDAIAGDRSLDVADAAALLFHAYMSNDASRLLHCAGLVSTIESNAISSAIYHQLLWVPHVALLQGQRFFEDNLEVSVLLRQLQFSVANDLDSDFLTSILERWIEESNFIQSDPLREGMQVWLWSKVATNRNKKLPLNKKLFAIDALRNKNGEVADLLNRSVVSEIDNARASFGGIPKGATVSQFLLFMHASSMHSLDDLSLLLDWLEDDASKEMKLDFEDVLLWPLTKGSGSFVHGAWATGHADTTEWNSTLVILERALSIARCFELSQFGSEVTKAISIVYGEHMGDHESAVRVLDDAAETFGETITIREQQANALFQKQDYARSLSLWKPILSSPALAKLLDSFSFRRAAISASHLGLWSEAENFYLAGAACAPELRLEITKFGLIADAAYVATLSGNPKRAASMLAEMLLDLPLIARQDGNESWDALLGVVFQIRECIELAAFGKEPPQVKLPFGKASEPGLSFGPAKPGQALRVDLSITQVALLSAQLGCAPIGYIAKLDILQNSQFPLIRYSSSLGLLTLEFHFGTGENLFDRLVVFENVFSSLRVPPDSFDETGSFEENLEKQPIDSLLKEDGWFTVFSAAAICCDDPNNKINLWLEAAVLKWGQQSEVAKDLSDMSLGLNIAVDEAWKTIKGLLPAERGVRFGAALGLLNGGGLSPANMFWLQLVLVSATVCHPQGLLLKQTFGNPIARRFAMSWETFFNSRFLFTSPRTTIPQLEQVVSAVKNGQASIKILLTAAARAVGAQLGDVGTRLD